MRISDWSSDVCSSDLAALDHAAEGRLRHVEAATEVDAHDIVPIVIAHARERAVAGDAGIVDDDVDRPEFLGAARAIVEARLMVADVPFARGDPGPLGDRARLFFIAGIVCDAGAALFLQLQARTSVV